MPDTFGLPTVDDVKSKLFLTAPEDIQLDIDEETQEVLDAVIAEFEAPVSYEDTGGTGRSWHTAAGIRRFDGTGYAELRVDDLVLPGVNGQGVVTNPLVVKVYDTVLSDVGVKQARVGLGNNTLYFQRGGAYFGADNLYERFPRGTNNIVVSATWGNVVPKDVYEAIRAETAYRMLVEGFVGLNGVGEDIKIGTFELNTSVGAINFKLTSPLTVFHDLFLKAIQRHKERADRNWQAYGASRRMS